MVDIFEAILYYVNIINKRIVTGNAGYTILWRDNLYPVIRGGGVAFFDNLAVTVLIIKDIKEEYTEDESC